MPMTVRSLSVYNEQQQARRFREKLVAKKYSKFMAGNKLFVANINYTHGDCFLWSTNILTAQTWFSVNCTYKIPYPFLICEKNNVQNVPLQSYKQSRLRCSSLYLYYDVHCIRLVGDIQTIQLNNNIIAPNLKTICQRILSAWTMHSNTIEKGQTLRIIKWRDDHDKCQCFTSTDVFHMENKTWYEEACSCNKDYQAVIVMLPATSLADTLTTTPINKLLYPCSDGNAILAIYQCDGLTDCNSKDDEDDCLHICSTHDNCTTECIYPACVCMSMYYQCAQGGCVHRSLVCDGVANCADDDSDELMCNYQLETPNNPKEPNYQQFSLCNSFTNESFPSLELCLLVRDQYGVTKHCNNTEHLHYCADFSCPNHYKCPHSYCIPMHTVCDGVKDCPQGKDEDQCSEFVCRGYMRCKGMSLCLHPNYLCNGAIDCTMYGDDEVLCDSTDCPTQCECVGFTISCHQVTLQGLTLKMNFNSKAIMITYSSIYIKDIPFALFSMIHLLNLSNSKIIPQFDPSSFRNMIHLRILDLTNVNIKNVGATIFNGLPSLTCLYLPLIQAPTLKAKTFHLPRLAILQLHTVGIQLIAGDGFCYLFQLNTLNISYNRVQVISDRTFTCLRSLKLLELSNNPLFFIATTAFEGIPLVSLSGHVRLCCFITRTSYCQLDNHIINMKKIYKHCHPLLQTDLMMKVVYGFVGSTLSLLSITVTVIVLYKKTTKITSYVQSMFISDCMNGIFIVIVLVCDFFKDLRSEHITHVSNILSLSHYLGVIPRISLMISLVEHFFLTLQMFVATCYIFSDYTIYIKNVRVVMWPMCLMYCIIDATLLRHINEDNLLVWQPYQLTDYSVCDIMSVTCLISYNIILCLVVLILYTRIYREVSLNEQRVRSQRMTKRLFLAKRLVQLAVGRVMICVFSTLLIVTLTFSTQLSIFVKQLLVAFELYVPLLVNIVLFCN